uniref:Solute carrier family 13 member 2 n=1 Tax=Echeneis naucrates TaxID=173247 RepID=A0A665TTF4_ECHNA
MALYWCTECMPLAVTALLPVVLFPMMGIMTAGEVSIEYLKDSNMLFIGGLLVAIAVEQWNLHKRIALRVLLLVGVRPSLLMMGFMIVSAFLSMWISNTATTAMMLPIAQAVLQQLKATEMQASDRDFEARGADNETFELEILTHQMIWVLDENDKGLDSLQESKLRAIEAKYSHLTKGMSLSVCYSASIGGTATLTGTTPNLILKGQIEELFPESGNVINFASWFGFAFPNMVLMLVFSWAWLQFLFLGFNLKKSFGCGEKTDRDKEAYAVMKEEYSKLGRMRFAETAVLIIFILLVVLWFTREPGFIDGELFIFSHHIYRRRIPDNVTQ